MLKKEIHSKRLITRPQSGPFIGANLLGDTRLVIEADHGQTASTVNSTPMIMYWKI